MSTRPSPLPNRVDPFGRITAHPMRGTMMGNRGGRLHEGWAIRRAQASRQWIICVTAFKGRARKVMESGYTELFFLDEATALAAGHRPCFECRRADAVAFRDAFGAARAPEIDRRLAPERRGDRPEVDIAALPLGAMAADGMRAFAVTPRGPMRWTWAGYQVAEAPRRARLLTPVSTVAALSRGYRPAFHSSAGP